MSHCDLILAALRDGSWKTTARLYHDCGPMILHSRISDLRKKGHRVDGRHVPGKSGAEGYEYRLAGEPPEWEYRESLRVRQPVDASSPDRVPAAEHNQLTLA